MHAYLGKTRKRRLAAVIGAAAAALSGIVALAPPAVAGSTVYSVTQTIPVPPASNYAGGGGGDGWGISLTPDAVYNVFHHQSSLNLACHRQSDASDCYPARTLTDGGGNGFASLAETVTAIDQPAQKIYIYATRSDQTGGVVCADLVAAATNPNPFCGFTPLVGVGGSPISSSSYLGIPVQVGNRLYSFNYVPNQPVQGDANTLLCFDLTTKAACPGQPYAVGFGGVTMSAGNLGPQPPPGAARIGSKIVVESVDVAGNSIASCFDPATGQTCTGSWPITLPAGAAGYGVPFPKLSSTGAVQGFCLPTGTDPCYDLNGAGLATPSGMPAAISAVTPWNGPAFVLGPRVYLANGNDDHVHCYNASTDASCVNFPKPMTNSSYMYSVNSDPQRPTCIWTNADTGSAQIQNFDAFSGAACGQGAIRVLAAQFVVDQVACQPASYTSLEVLTPARSSYSDGTVAFQDADAQPIPGIPDRALDGAGKVDLSGLNLSTALGLPQFVINLNGLQGTPGQVVVRLTWTGVDDPACVPSGAPKVDAGPVVTGVVGTPLALKGSATGTPALTTIWSVPAGTPCTIAAPASVTTSVSCTKVGDYTLTLKGTDGTNSASDTTVAHVTANGFACHGVPATIVGTQGNDSLVGTAGDDVIVGRGGNDKIRGGGGNDVICGDAGNDVVHGQAGNDRLYGRGGADQVVGDKGADKLGGGHGNDVLRGKDGNDVLRGSFDDDTVFGGAGEDRLLGQKGDDRLVGDTGDDTLVGGNGKDRLSGKAGDDKLLGMEDGDRASGGTGDDDVHGGPGPDRLIGGAGSNTLAGGAGQDRCGATADGPDTFVSCEVRI